MVEVKSNVAGVKWGGTVLKFLTRFAYRILIRFSEIFFYFSKKGQDRNTNFSVVIRAL